MLSPVYVAQYAKSEKAHRLFPDHVTHVVNRVNRYTGKKYREDPAIMSWQIGKRAPSRSVRRIRKALRRGLRIVRHLLNHRTCIIWSRSDRREWPVVKEIFHFWTSIHADANIDYATIHIWPNNWGWIDQERYSGKLLGEAIKEYCSYIDIHAQEAYKINKPLVLEEFGLPRDSVKFASGQSDLPTADLYYRERLISSKSVLPGKAFFKDVISGHGVDLHNPATSSGKKEMTTWEVPGRKNKG